MVVLQAKRGTEAAMRATEPNPTASGNTVPNLAKASALPKRSWHSGETSGLLMTHAATDQEGFTASKRRAFDESRIECISR